MPTYDEKTIRPFLDEEGRIAQFPSKRHKQLEVLKYLASRLKSGAVYTQEEIDIFLIRWHIFDDHCLLRRELCDAGLLRRERDGSAYTLPAETP